MIVEDSPEDYEATLRAFRKTGCNDAFFHCENGDDTLDYLFNQGDYADSSKAPRPDLIVLDLNLPGTDGRQVLFDIKSHPLLKTIPVVVLSTSSHPQDVNHCYQSGANTYIQKTVGFDELLKSIEKVVAYWLALALLPEAPCLI